MRCLIFDLDGVIIDSHQLQIKALLESYRCVVGEGEPPYEEFFRNSGDSLSNILKKLKLPQEIIPYYLEISVKNMAMIKIHKDIEEIILKLVKKGFKCAVCTGKDRKRTLEILEYLKLRKFFNAIVCSDDVLNPKPASDSLLKAIECMNGNTSNSIMIGDGINDILCARNANVASIGVSWGDLKKSELVKIGPDYIVDTIKELEEAIYDKFNENGSWS